MTNPVVICLQRRANSSISPVHKLPVVVSAKSRQVLGRRVSRSPINCLKSRRLSQFTVSHCCTFTATWFVLSSLLWLHRGEMRANEMADPEAVSIFQQKRDAYTSEGLARNASISCCSNFPKRDVHVGLWSGLISCQWLCCSPCMPINL